MCQAPCSVAASLGLKWILAKFFCPKECQNKIVKTKDPTEHMHFELILPITQI